MPPSSVSRLIPSKGPKPWKKFGSYGFFLRYDSLDGPLSEVKTTMVLSAISSRRYCHAPLLCAARTASGRSSSPQADRGWWPRRPASAARPTRSASAPLRRPVAAGTEKGDTRHAILFIVVVCDAVCYPAACHPVCTPCCVWLSNGCKHINLISQRSPSIVFRRSFILSACRGTAVWTNSCSGWRTS